METAPATYTIERRVFDADRQFIGAALSTLANLPNASEYFEPIHPEALHTTLLSSREFEKIARTPDDTAPIHVIPESHWQTALENGLARLPYAVDGVRAHVTGFVPLIDRNTAADGWKSFAITIRNSQLQRERSHIATMASKLTKKAVILRQDTEFRHHITLGSIDPNNYDPAFMERAQRIFSGSLVSLDPLVVRPLPVKIVTR